MEPSELLRLVVSILERLHIRYFVTGSTVTIFYGEPRFTNDIDVVVDLSADTVVEFCRQFPEDDFYVSAEAAMDAVHRHSMFNIIQPRSGLKVDVIVPAPSAFNRERFARARRVRAGEDWDASFSSPEDAILKKMEFHREGGSDKHLRDIASVLRTSGDEIDTAYIERWAGTLGLTDVWRAILERLREP
ncbi:MAG: hypothetical protein ABL986_15830 [Vicinamibacterales bacterium]